MPGNLYDFGQPSVRATVIRGFEAVLRSHQIDGVFLDGADKSGLERQTTGCDKDTQDRFLKGHVAFHTELRDAVGPSGPIITLGDLYKGDSGELLGLMFLSSDGFPVNVWQVRMSQHLSFFSIHFFLFFF